MPGSSHDPRLRWIDVLVAAADLRAERSSPVAAAWGLVATVPGRLNGVMIHFELERAPGIRLPTRPDRAGRRRSWAHRVWGLPEPLLLEPGARHRLTRRHGGAGRPNGVRVSPASPGGEGAAPGR